MVNLRGGHHDRPAAIRNMTHQHAFTLVGDEHLFGVHMTQFHCEIHKYQLVFELSLPADAHRKLRRIRKAFPSDFLVLCNQSEDDPPHADYPQPLKFSVPELAARRRTFMADIFQGLPPLKDDGDPNDFPWKRAACRPAIADVEVTVERVVMFRPFPHHEDLPPFATYLLFGKGREAHMTNLQTACLASGPFEPHAFGADYDHVMSLVPGEAGFDDLVEPVMLEAGIVVTTPAVRLRDPDTGRPSIPCDPPFRYNDPVTILYRGMPPAREVVAGHSFLYCTAVCNSPSMIPCPPEKACHISPMPEKYLA